MGMTDSPVGSITGAVAMPGGRAMQGLNRRDDMRRVLRPAYAERGGGGRTLPPLTRPQQASVLKYLRHGYDLIPAADSAPGHDTVTGFPRNGAIPLGGDARLLHGSKVSCLIFRCRKASDQTAEE